MDPRILVAGFFGVCYILAFVANPHSHGLKYRSLESCQGLLNYECEQVRVTESPLCETDLIGQSLNCQNIQIDDNSDINYEFPLAVNGHRCRTTPPNGVLACKTHQELSDLLGKCNDPTYIYVRRNRKA